MGEAPPFDLQDHVTVLVDVGDDITLFLEGRIVGFRNPIGEPAVYAVSVTGLPPADDEGNGALLFQGKDFINADIGRPEVFITDNIGRADE